LAASDYTFGVLKLFLYTLNAYVQYVCLHKAEYCCKKYRPSVQVSVHGVGNGPDSGGYELTEKWGGDMFSD